MTDDDDLYRADDGATALTPEDREALIPTWIVTRDDLNRAERDNIAAGLRWARRRGFDVLDPDDLMTLHKRMFGDVWRWAGHRDQMLMVSEEQHLGRLRQLGEHLKASSRPAIIIVDEEIVGDEGQDGTRANRIFNSRHAQGQEQLINRALAHDFDRHNALVLREAR